MKTFDSLDTLGRSRAALGLYQLGRIQILAAQDGKWGKHQRIAIAIGRLTAYVAGYRDTSTVPPHSFLPDDFGDCYQCGRRTHTQ